MLIAARDNGFQAQKRDRILLDTVGRYRAAMAEFAGITNTDVRYSHLDIERVVKTYASQFKPKLVKRAEKGIAKARTKDSMTAFSKLTEVVDGKTRIVEQSPLIVPARELASGVEFERLCGLLQGVLRGYRETIEGLLDELRLPLRPGVHEREAVEPDFGSRSQPETTADGRSNRTGAEPHADFSRVAGGARTADGQLEGVQR